MSTFKFELSHSPTPAPVQLRMFPKYLPLNESLTSASFPNISKMRKLFANYSPPTNVQKNVRTIDRKSSALDVYLNIVRPAHWKWFKYIAEKGIRIGEGNSASDLMYAQNILFIKAVQDILQNKSYAKICEIGFNMGHSALTWLIADYPSNRTKFLGFSWNHVHHQMCAHELRSYLNLKDRKTDVFQVIWGDSTLTVPAYIKLAGKSPEMEKCDIIFVDGGHSKQVPWTDLINMKQLANLQKHYVFMDDTCSNAGYCTSPLKAWKKAIAKNITTQYLCWESKSKGRGFCMGKYN